MARKLRIEYAEAMDHVTARGNDRQAIFQTVADRRHLLELLTEAVERYEVHLYACALMQNHYHLVLHRTDSGRTRSSRPPSPSRERRLLEY